MLENPRTCVARASTAGVSQVVYAMGNLEFAKRRRKIYYPRRMCTPLHPSAPNARLHVLNNIGAMFAEKYRGFVHSHGPAQIPSTKRINECHAV